MGRVGKQTQGDDYWLTPAGNRKLQTEAEKWNPMAEVIAGILQSTSEEI